MDVPFRLNRDTRAEDISRSLLRNGVALIDGFLSKDDVAALKTETLSLYETAAERDLTFAKSKVKRLPPDEAARLSRTRPALKKAGDNPAVQAVCDDFFGRRGWAVGNLYSMHYKDSMPTNEVFHIDPSPNVKFFYYLNDVELKNGAFTYCVGSHREGYFRMRCEALEGRFGSYVIPDDEVRDPTPMEAPAGSLIVFNSIGIHKAGEMQPGTERLTLTYHFEPAPNRSLFAKVYRRLRPQDARIAHLCAYTQKHKTLSSLYGE